MNERIERIKLYALEKEAEKKTQEVRENIRTDMLIDEIRGLSKRISALIEVANCCLENGIKVYHYDDYPCDVYKDGNFSKLQWNPSFDLPMCNGKICGKIKWLTMRNTNHGDFLTDGVETGDFLANGTEARPSAENLKRFLERFDYFEEMFYGYVDKITGNKEA